ncbi:MAG: penicillin-binding protein [Deltaproteobacteria bacterium]
MKRRGQNTRISQSGAPRGAERARWKFYLTGALVLALFVGVLGQAFKLQVLDRDRTLEVASRQQTGLFTLLPRRGKILDANSKELAVNIDAESVYLRPKEVGNKAEYAQKIAKAMKLPKRDIINLLDSGKSFVWVKRLADAREVENLRKFNLEAVGFIKEAKRVYPNGYLAGQVLGFTNVDSKGMEGIEYYFEETIGGNPGKISVKRDARGRQITNAPFDAEGSITGSDVVLTIDSHIQFIAEKELKEGIEQTRAERGMALVMRSETGEILAMASYPFFNPADFKRVSKDKIRNLPVWHSFEPGSTAKIFLIAAALEDKKVNPASKFDCENGRRKVGPAIIKDVHPYKILSVAEILTLSSNICSSKIAESLGRDRLYEYLKNFGFGSNTGIDLPGEGGGLLMNSKRWGPVELATISFGQGVSVTAIQLAAALSAVANGGELMKPYAVKKIIGLDGKTLKENKPQVVRQVISYDTASDITQMLEDVVQEGTGKKASIMGYRVAGKTGTAQIPNPETKGYYADRYNSSFIGFAPADDPKITVIVAVENPRTSQYGGVVAAPIFKGITEKTLFYLGVPPQKSFAEKKIMPDLRGMSGRDILRWAEKEGVKIKMQGSGYANDQKPKAGERIEDGTVCSIELRQAI